MPWMLFYQQAATVDKGLGVDDLPAARAETLVGAIASELLMVAVVVATAAAMAGPVIGLGATVGALPVGLGRLATGAPGLLIAVGMIGSGLLAAVVISLSSAWAWSELFRWPHSLNLSLRRAPGFYALYLLEVVPACHRRPARPEPANRRHRRDNPQRCGPRDPARLPPHVGRSRDPG